MIWIGLYHARFQHGLPSGTLTRTLKIEKMYARTMLVVFLTFASFASVHVSLTHVTGPLTWTLKQVFLKPYSANMDIPKKIFGFLRRPCYFIDVELLADPHVKPSPCCRSLCLSGMFMIVDLSMGQSCNFPMHISKARGGQFCLISLYRSVKTASKITTSTRPQSQTCKLQGAD